MTCPAGGKGAVLQKHIRDIYRSRGVCHIHSDSNLCDPAVLRIDRAMHMSKICHHHPSASDEEIRSIVLVSVLPSSYSITISTPTCPFVPSDRFSVAICAEKV